MKRLFTIFLGFSTALTLNAQVLVDNTVQKKNAILEIYSGNKNTFDPDAHMRIDNLTNQNPGRIVDIRIHCGAYASGTPDYNTYLSTVNYGNTLYQHPDVKLAGFPAGSINRRNFGNGQNGGIATSRHNWAGNATTILAENSPVNVSVYPFYNTNTGDLKVYVEAYYTSTIGSNNKVHVGILQDKVYGPQSGGSTFYPAKWDASRPTGQEYEHNNMLRAVLTGQWGDAITTTSTGNFWSKTYTYSVPTSINGVNVDVNDLKVYAFVSKDQQTAYTGEVQPVNFSKLDFEVTEVKVTSPVPDSGNTLRIGDTLRALHIKLKNNSDISLSAGQEVPVIVTVNGQSESGVIALDWTWNSGSTYTDTITDISLFSSLPTSSGAFPICVELDWSADMLTSNDELCTSYSMVHNLDIADFNPKSGAPSTEVWITGEGFSSTLVDNKVYFNGVEATQILATSTTTQLNVLVPSGASTGQIKVVKGSEQDSTQSDFEVISNVGYGELENSLEGEMWFAEDNIYVNLKDASYSVNPTLDIYNITGSFTRQFKVSNNIENVVSYDVSNLPSGYYIAVAGQSRLKFFVGAE